MHLKNRLALILLTVLLASAISIPCAWGGEASSANNKDDSGKKVSKELGEAFDAMKQYGFEKKEQFVAWAEERTKELDQKIDTLKDKMDKAGAKANKDWQKTLEDLKIERQKVAKDLDSLKKSSKGAWEDLKWGFSAAYSKMEQAYDKAAEHFKGKDEDQEMKQPDKSGSSDEGMKK